jgi:AcrR family transcriptional regulator
MLGTPTRDRRNERREATRQEILDSAWEIAREHGVAALTLRDVAARVGMQAPSLYSYFGSKNEIYDAMFRDAWSEALELNRQIEDAGAFAARGAEVRAALTHAMTVFFDFFVADPARYVLMNQRTIPGFEPSPESYAPAVECLDTAIRALRQLGIDRPDAIDLWTALVAGLTHQQIANDPGGDRWRKHIDAAVAMFCDAMGVPAAATRTATPKSTGRKR